MNSIEKILDELYRRRAAQQEPGTGGEAAENLLLARYLDGTASSDEQRQVARLRAERPDIDEVVRVVGGAMADVPQHTPRVQRARWARAVHVALPYAACALLAAGVSLWAVCRHRPGAPSPGGQPCGVSGRAAQWRGQPPCAGAPEFAKEFASPAAPVRVPALEIDNSGFAPASATLYSRACALLIGIDDYDLDTTGFAPLQSAVADTRRVFDALRAFQFGHIATLENAAATKDGILRAGKLLAQEAGPDGALFIYFAGHGMYDGDMKEGAALVPFDGGTHPAARARNITADELRAVFERAPVKHVFLAADSCFAGALAMRSYHDYICPAPDFFYYQERAAKPVVQFLAACRMRERAADGLFADALVEALAAYPDEPCLPAARVSAYVAERVPRAARRLAPRHVRPQTPVHGKLRDEGGEFIFARTNAAPLVFHPPQLIVTNVALPPVLTGATDCAIADLNDDGCADFLFTKGRHVAVMDGATGRLRFRSLPHLFAGSFGPPADIDGDGTREIAVNAGADGQNSIVLLDARLRRVRQFTMPSQVSVLTAMNGRIFYEGVNLAACAVADLSGHGDMALLAMAFCGYRCYPRELRAYSIAEGRELWRAPACMMDPARLGLAVDPDGPGTLILVPDGSLGNGWRPPDGSDDFHAHVRLLGADGRQRWLRRTGGLYAGSRAGFHDLNRDGRLEILVFNQKNYLPTNMAAFMETLTNDLPALQAEAARIGEYPATLGDARALIADLRRENGMLFLYDLGGTLIRACTNYDSVTSATALPNYVAQRDDLLIAVRGGELRLLDPHFNLLTSVRLTNTSGHVSLPVIKGVMRTRCGEYVAVYYHEYQRIVFTVGAITGCDPVTCYHGVSVKLLDKKTLTPRFDIPLDTSGGLITEREVYLCDIDGDDEDELVVWRPAALDIYRVTSPLGAKAAP